MESTRIEWFMISASEWFQTSRPHSVLIPKIIVVNDNGMRGSLK